MVFVFADVCFTSFVFKNTSCERSLKADGFAVNDVPQRMQYLASHCSYGSANTVSVVLK